MAQPMLLSTWSFGLRGHAAAWPGLVAGGSSLDAVERACTAVEADPEVDSVGLGGLPDRDGQVSLDACVMLSPSRCGSVCAVRRHLHVTSLARLVMERTGHVMIAGEGADQFADACGMAAASLVTNAARHRWNEWRAKPQAGNADQSKDSSLAPLRPVDRGSAEISHGQLFAHADESRRVPGHDTIGVLALDSRGELAGACSTSGTPFKIPGRVGDSPIIGHGLYVHPAHGAATATGTGELIMGVCGSFLAVELMRRGAAPVDALRDVLQRIVDSFDLRSRGDRDQVAMLALRPAPGGGAWAAAALRPGFLASITTVSENHAVPPMLVMNSSPRGT